jgi:dynein heavy chain
LETKRQYFPRFYFLSNEELLEILGESKKPLKVQKHLKKCFEGINELIFSEKTEILGMISKEDEQVPFNQNIYPYEYKGNVEQWLLEVENEMKSAMRTIMSESIANFHVMGE